MTNPSAGEVFRYPFLWKREQMAGETEGRKTRPVCIAVTVAKSDSETVVFILPVTTQPPLAEGANFIVSGEWWLALFPGVWLMLAVFTFNLLGDGLRDLVDPRQRT